MKKIMGIQMEDTKVDTTSLETQANSQDSSSTGNAPSEKAASSTVNAQSTASAAPEAAKVSAGPEADPGASAKGRRGGFRKGAGRKPIPEGKHINLLVTATQKETLTKLGGPAWLRNVLQAATLDQLPLKISQIKRLPSAPISIPYLDFSVQAGFPSPAEAYVKENVDLNQLLVNIPAATFLLKASGNSMVSAGIGDGDLLVLDRSKEPRHGDIVIMRVNDEFTVKRLYHKDGVLKLEAESPDPAYTDIYPGEGDEWVAVGVVTYVIKKV